MSSPRPIALLVNDTGDGEPSLRLLRTERSIARAVDAGALVVGADGRTIAPASDASASAARRDGGSREAEAEALARLERAHTAMTRRLGLPDPDLPDAAAHVAALSYIGRMGLHRAVPDPDDDTTVKVINKARCFGCAVLGITCAGCPKLG